MSKIVPMLKCTAQLINRFHVPASDKYPESHKIQLLGDEPRPDGEQVRKVPIDLSVSPEIYELLKGHEGRFISLPIACFAQGGRLNYYFPKGSDVSEVSVKKTPAQPQS